MNIFPAAIVFLICMAAGFLKSSHLKRRVQLLSELRQLTSEFSVSIGYIAPTLDELADSCSGIFGQLLHQQRQHCLDIRTAWSNAVQQLSEYSFCEKYETELLRDLGKRLGTCDTNGQLSILKMYNEKFAVLCTQAEEIAATKGKLFRSIGTLAGAGAAILII